jgi:hypothetical protein
VRVSQPVAKPSIRVPGAGDDRPEAVPAGVGGQPLPVCLRHCDVLRPRRSGEDLGVDAAEVGEQGRR